MTGHDTLALLPTGGGKSICFQVPALATEGICIVISPLIALMKDQVYNLKKRNIKAAAIFSGMTKKEIDRILDNCIYGNVKFLYISPERLQTEIFQLRLAKMKVNLIAIDEAHCISQWGYDFRPSYLKIEEIRNIISDVPLLALTATATDRVKIDIQDKLGFKAKTVFQKSFKRNNLSYSVFYEDNKLAKLLQILKNVKGTGIVYVRSRKKTKQIAEILRKNRISADYYHAGLEGKTRAKKQEAWINNRIRVMVCTNAFGMGIDKPDVRIVVHIDLPESLEAYYQEAGRAGRDLKKSYAVLLYNKADHLDLEKRFSDSFPAYELIQKTYQSLGNYFKVAIGAGEGQGFCFDLRAFCQTYQLKPIATFNVLKILQENNYLLTNDAVHLPARLMVIVDKTELYKIEVANRRLEPYIKTILRTYGGILDDYVAIDEREIARNLKVKSEYVKNALTFMQKNKIVDYIPQTDQPSITFTSARVATDRLHINKQLFNFRKEVRQKNIDAVIQYTSENNVCRSEQLVRYFGEFNSTSCGVCDVCIRKRKANGKEQLLDKISHAIQQELQKQVLEPEQLITQLTQQQQRFKKQEILEALRWLLEEEKIKRTADNKLEVV